MTFVIKLGEHVHTLEVINPFEFNDHMAAFGSM